MSGGGGGVGGGAGGSQTGIPCRDPMGDLNSLSQILATSHMLVDRVEISNKVSVFCPDSALGLGGHETSPAMGSESHAVHLASRSFIEQRLDRRADSRRRSEHGCGFKGSTPSA